MRGVIFTLIAVIAIGYQAAAILACLRSWKIKNQTLELRAEGPVSVLKPNSRVDSRFARSRPLPYGFARM